MPDSWSCSRRLRDSSHLRFCGRGLPVGADLGQRSGMTRDGRHAAGRVSPPFIEFSFTWGAFAPIDEAMRIVAVLFGMVIVVGSIVQGFIAAFVLTVCTENCGPPTRPLVVGLVMGAAIIVAIPAVFFVVSIGFGSFRYAALGFVVHLIAAVSLLAFWLHESHASDGELLTYFLAFESFAVVALIVCGAEQPKRPREDLDGVPPPERSPVTRVDGSVLAGRRAALRMSVTSCGPDGYGGQKCVTATSDVRDQGSAGPSAITLENG